MPIGKFRCNNLMKILDRLDKTTILSILMISLAALPALVLPTALAQSTGSSIGSSTISARAPVYGAASKVLLSGPMHVTASELAKPAVTFKPSASTPKYQLPYPKPTVGTGTAAPAVKPSFTAPPVVSCPGTGCDTISTSSGGATSNPLALNAVDSGALYGLDIEPPDQGLCAGNGYVMEVNNLGELRVFNTALGSVSGDITLDNLMGLPSIPASMGGPWSSGGDPSCLYDYDNGGHWFVTEIVSNSSWAQEGPFGGCFVAKVEGCFEGIAVSVSNNPLGDYNVYFMNANYNPSEPGYPQLLNDFAKIGNTRDAFLVFYDEFPLAYPSNPGFGGGFFNGAQEFAFNKKALELGWPVTEPVGTPNPYFNVVIENMGLIPTPDGACSKVVDGFAGVDCWYAVIPGQSPDPSQYDNARGGSGFMLGALDFLGFALGIGSGDNRISAWAWTGLSNLLSINCSTCSSIGFRGQLFTGVQVYMDEGQACLASGGGFCGLGTQKAGPIPLGDNCGAYGLSSDTSCPESGLATNDDGFTQASYASGQIWGAVSTLINQQFASSTETHIGAAYWVVGTSTFDSSGTFSLTDQGYVTGAHEDLEFPAIGASDGSTAVMTFTLNGLQYYPSTAFGTLTTASHGLSPNVIRIADLGRSPQDGFTEYQGYPGTTRPRWGDYSWAIYDSATNTVFFATNYIQSPNCSDSAFLKDPSCGGTRDPNANWGTSVNSVTP